MNTREAPDELLMQEVVEGSEAALEELMKRYHGPLLSFIGGKTDADAEDIYQETWLRVVRSRRRYDPGRKFSTWLFQIAVNICRDNWRRKKARPETTPIEGSGAERIAAPAAENDSKQLARLALEILEEDDRQLLELRYFQGMKEREVAEILGIPRGTVKSRTHAAIKKIKERIDELR